MAVPKKKTSYSRQRLRRSGHTLQAVALSICPNCKNYKRPHHVCPHCGYYKGRLVIQKRQRGEAAVADSPSAG